ncbi:MAG: NADPH:quinone oxidoreductase family protein [Kofleriaceae bacterium]
MSHPDGHRVIVHELAEAPLDGLDQRVTLEPMPAPEAASLGPDEVLVRVRATSVNWVDLLMTSGQYQHLAKPPYTPGLEFAGEILAVGAAVTERKVGDRVMVDGFLAGPRSLGAYQRVGGYATYAVVPAAATLPVPAPLSLVQACNLLGNYETAYHALVARGRVTAGDVVLVHGASGSTGLAAVHIAKRLGATVIATGRSDDKLAVVAAQGADHVINCRDLGGLRDAVRGVTGGRGADVVYDGVGGELSVASLRCVAFGARYLLVGWAATPLVADGAGRRGAPNANTLPTNLILMKGLDVLGCPAMISAVEDPSLRPVRQAQVLAWVAAGEIVPYVGRVAPLTEFREVMRAKWRGEIIGGCALEP